MAATAKATARVESGRPARRARRTAIGATVYSEMAAHAASPPLAPANSNGCRDALSSARQIRSQARNRSDAVHAWLNKVRA